MFIPFQMLGEIPLTSRITNVWKGMLESIIFPKMVL